MKAVEKFLEENVRNDSNIVIGYHPNGIQQYYPWIPLRYARKIGELARKETIKEVCEWLRTNMVQYMEYCYNGTGESVEEFTEDLKKYLNN